VRESRDFIEGGRAFGWGFDGVRLESDFELTEGGGGRGKVWVRWTTLSGSIPRRRGREERTGEFRELSLCYKNGSYCLSKVLEGAGYIQGKILRMVAALGNRIAKIMA